MKNEVIENELSEPMQELNRMIQEIHDHCDKHDISMVVGALVDDTGEEGTCCFISKNAHLANGTPLFLLHIAIQAVAHGGAEATESAMDYLNQIIHRHKSVPIAKHIQ